MPARRSSGTRLRAARRHQARAARRARRIAGLTAIAVVLVVSLLLTAFGSGASRVREQIAIPSTLQATGRPAPEIVAVKDALRIQLPVARPTAIGFHASGDGAVALSPVGHQGNQGALTRLFHKIFGGGGGGPTWYQLGGDQGPANSALDVGALPGTDVYSPVDGNVVAISPFVLDGRPYGVRIDIQPQTTPSLVVSLTHVRADPSIRIGTPVVAGVSKLGNVIDLSSVERQALARFTQDAGNNVSIEVRAAATVALN
jgi:hypothetical protein